MLIAGLAAVLMVAACGDSSNLPEQAGVGPTPTLPEPKQTTIPT
jgi:hypothetical protein